MAIKARRTSHGIRKLVLAGTASIMALGLGAAAMASGYVSVGYNSGYYNQGYYGAGYYGGYNNHYYGHQRRRHHGHGGGGKAAAIALGVIGGAIILNELSEDRARRRYEDRSYSRYDRYSARATPLDTGYAGRARLPRESYGGAGESTETGGDAIDTRLDGGPAPIRISFSGAYETCLTHARAALADRDFTLAAPANPDTADDIGGAWKMTANVTTQNRDGESWTRAMYCEADEARVYLLELL